MKSYLAYIAGSLESFGVTKSSLLEKGDVYFGTCTAAAAPEADGRQATQAHTLTWPAQGIENKRTRELSEDELTTLRDEVEKYTIEGDLRRFNALNIKRLKEIQCYRGRRHIAVSALPCRGS